jgi:hypothetical protein
MKKGYLLIGLIIIIALVSGCGFFNPSIKTDKGEVQLNKNGLEVKNNDGSTSKMEVATEKNQSVALPEGYPTDLAPVMDGARVIFANKNDNPNKKPGFTVAMEVESNLQDVTNFYKEVLKGGTNTSEANAGGGGMLAAEKGDYMIAIYSGYKDDIKKVISITLTLTPKEANQ